MFVFRSHTDDSRGRGPRTRAPGLAAALVMAVLAWGAGQAPGVVFNWVASPADNIWGNAVNWDTGTVPNAADSQVVFSSSSITTLTINNPGPTAADKTVQSIAFAGPSSFTINAGGVIYLRHSDGILVQTGAPGQTFNAEVRPTIGGSASYNIVNNGTGLLAFSSWNSSPGNNATMVVGGTGDTRVNQLIRRYANQATNMSLVKEGAGTLTIVSAYSNAGNARGDASSYGYPTGTTTINAGAISINAEANLGGDPGGYWTYVGGVDIFVPGSFNAAALTLNGGTLRATATFTIDDTNRGVTLGASGGAFDVPNAAHALTIANPIAGPGSLTKTGAGTLVLTNAGNTYAGSTDINAGVLQFNSAAAIGGTGRSVTANFGATAAFGPSYGDIQGTLTGRIVNSSAGTVALTAASSENLDFSAAGANLTAASLGAVGAATYSGTLTPNGTTYRLGGGGGTLTVSSSLTGANSLVVHGSGSSGTVVLSGANSYTGTTTVEPGVLSISAANNLGSGGIILNGGTLQTTTAGRLTLSHAITLTANSFLDTRNTTTDPNAIFAGVISDGAGTFGFTKIGSGNLILSGNNTYDGETILTGGTTYINKNTSLGSTVGGTTVTGTLTLESAGMNVAEPLTLNGTLRMYPNSGSSTYSGPITLTANSTLAAKIAGTTFNVTGNIGGNFGLTINNEPGTVRLSGASTYTGTTSVRQSTLLIGANAPSGAPGALGNTTSAVNLGISGTPLAENLAILTDGAYTVGRDIVVGNQNSAGTTTIGGNQTTGASTFSGAITLNRDVILTSANTDGGTVTFSGPISGAPYGVTKTGPGTVVLSGANSYGAGTTINQGTLRFLTDANLGAAGAGITLAGGTLDYGGTADYYTVSRPITLTADSSIRTSSGRSMRLSGKISDGAGVFGFTMSGGYVYLGNGTNDYDGPTVVASGALYAQANGALGSTNGATTVQSGGTLTVDTNYSTPETLYLNGGILRTSYGGGSTATWAGDVVLGADSAIRAKVSGGQSTLVLSGPISGNYGLRIGDGEAGIVKLTGNSSYTGPTTVYQGNLVVNGSIASSSALEVRAGATLQGYGFVPAISGAGLVSPGNSPGILTAPSVDPALGLDFAFEFRGQDPDYGNPGASANDVLRLTSLTDPFASPFQPANEIDIYLNVADLGVGDTFRGGFYTDLDQDFTSWIEGATLNYFIALDGNGPEVFEGVGYYPLAGAGLVPAMGLQTVPALADFGGGPVHGFVMQLTAVPEPSTLALGAIALLALGAWARRRRAKAAAARR